MSDTPSTLLEIISTGVVAAFGWAFRLERRSWKTAQQQEDHEVLCTERQGTIKRDLAEIKSMLLSQNKHSQEHREAVAKSLGDIQADIAVLQALREEKRA